MTSQAGASSSSISSSSFGGRNSNAQSSVTSTPSNTNESLQKSGLNSKRPFHVPQLMPLSSEDHPFDGISGNGGNEGDEGENRRYPNKNVQSAPANMMGGGENALLYKQMGFTTTPMDSTMTGNDMTTPETQWGPNSASIQSAPLVTLTSESINNPDFFDFNDRPYTPSYNSVGDFSDVLSDQQEFLQSIGEQIEGLDFAFDDQSGERGVVIPSFHYDPDTADSYNHLNAALLSQSVLTEQRTGEDRRRRSQNRQESSKTIVPPLSELEKDKIIEEKNKGLPTFAFSGETGDYRERQESFASPTASPLLGSIQSPLHTRHSSFGSSAEFSSQPNLEGDPAFQQMQTLGQRMTLHDPILVSHSNESTGRVSTDAPQQRSQLQSTSQGPYFAPVFEEDAPPAQAATLAAAAAVTSGTTTGVGNNNNNTISEGLEEGQETGPSTSFPSYTYSLPSQDATSISNSNGSSVPMLSLNDATLQFESSGGQSMNDGIQSSSSSNQTQSSTNSRVFQFPTRTQQQSMQNQWILGNTSEHTFMNNNDADAAPYASLAQQQISSYNPNAFNTGSSQRPSSSSAGQHGGYQDPKRQDSDDRVRKFLRLDVDMGFQAEREMINSSEIGPRKRSNSDFGLSYKDDGVLQGDEIPSPPPYAVVPGGVSDKTPIAMQSGVDWATEAAKQRRMQQLAAFGFQDNSNNTTSNLDGMNDNSINSTSMDPLLLQKQQQEQQQAAENLYQQQMLQYQQNPASGPVRQRESSFSGRGIAAPYPGHGRAASSGSIASNSSTGQPIFQSMQQQQQQQSQQSVSPMSDLHRSLSSRSGRVGRHSRLAQSEDLSQLARMSNPHEFLTRITAPDGGLAPPNTQSTGMPSMGPPLHSTLQRGGLTRIDTSVPMHASFATAPQMGMYGAQYPKSQEELQAMMNRYGSIRSSPSDTQYNQTETPSYTTLHPNNRTQASAASPYEMEGNAIPIIQQVTTSATQAASASRRKNEAIHVCPIPGCGSTFTRKFNLNGHIRSHTGQRPYQCRAPGCGKSFARSFDLSRHEKLHAGVKPHTCENCGKAFARADALSRHLRNDAGAGGCAQRLSESDNGDTFDEGSRSNSHIAINEMGGMDLTQLNDQQQNAFMNKTESIRVQANDTAIAGSTAVMAGMPRKENKFKGHIL